MEDIRQLYLEWAMDYCNNYFVDEEIPAGFKLAVDRLTEIDPLQFGLTSVSLSDMSKSYATNDGGIPKHIITWLNPYRRPATLEKNRRCK